MSTEWKMVPVIPTPGMIMAGSDGNPTDWNDGTDPVFAEEVAGRVWRAMLSAAPDAPGEPVAWLYRGGGYKASASVERFPWRLWQREYPLYLHPAPTPAQAVKVNENDLPDTIKHAFFAGRSSVRDNPETASNPAAAWKAYDCLTPALERVMSALEPAPDLSAIRAEEKRKALEEAAMVAKAQADMIGRIMSAGWRGNPHMSGDDRNFMQGSTRRLHDDRAFAAAEHCAAAIRALATEGK